jgi:hypothetical protein
MKTIVSLFLLFVTTMAAASGPVATAGQFKSVIDAIAIKTSDTQAPWARTTRIKGVEWQWPHYKAGAHDYAMLGTARVLGRKIPPATSVDMKVKGVRGSIEYLEITIGMVDTPVDVLMDVFGKGQVSKIKTSCDEDALGRKTAFYRFDKAGYKPLYISHVSGWGANGMLGTINFVISYKQDHSLSGTHTLEPCKVIE